MKKTLVIASIVIAALYCSSCSASRSASDGLQPSPKALTNQVKILSVSAKNQLNNKTDVKKFADWIKTTGAELVAVQQILRATDSKPGFDAFTELLRQLDMRGTFAKARYFRGWDSGNALFCLYPLLQSNAYGLPTGKGKIRRSLSFGVFEMGLKPMAFASTDLDVDNLSERAKQEHEILSIQQSVEEYPIIVAGDFGESASATASSKMLGQYFCANNSAEETAEMGQRVYIPSNGKTKVLSSEKVHYKELNMAAILVTVEVTQ